MGIVIPLILLLIILCYSCGQVGYDIADRRAKRAEQEMLKYEKESSKYRNLYITAKQQYEAEHELRREDISDYNELVDKHRALYNQYQLLFHSKSESQTDIQSPLIKEMLRFAMTQAHPDAGKEKTPDRFIKYREEYERLYKGGR